MSAPGFIVGAPRSGSGKTTITLGLLRAFARRGVRVAPVKCGPDYIDTAFHARAAGRDTIDRFMSEALPRAAEAGRTLAGELIATTLSQVGKRFSTMSRTTAEIERYADAMADMLCAYLAGLAAGSMPERGLTAGSGRADLDRMSAVAAKDDANP